MQIGDPVLLRNVNLQAPLIVSAGRFDTTDWALDVVVSPSGGWSWKDEDDLEKAVALNILDETAAAAVREEGKRVIEQQPWPTGWEGWRPPPEWPTLPLPADWAAIERSTATGSHVLRIQRASCGPGDDVALVDDWFETGSQAHAAKSLIEQAGCRWAGASVIVDQLPDPARTSLSPCHSLIAADLRG